MEFNAEINPYQLDEERRGNPGMVYHWSKLVADAKKLQEESKNHLKVVKAQIELTVRRQPATYGFEKVTEGVVSAVVAAAQEVIDAEAAIVDANHDVATLSAAVKALDDRGHAISDLIKLHLAGYYSKPKVDPTRKENRSGTRTQRTQETGRGRRAKKNPKKKVKRKRREESTEDVW